MFELYVGNLDYNTTAEDLRVAFEPFGAIMSIWVAQNPPGFAFVGFESEREAQEAWHRMDGQIMNNRRLKVNASFRSNQRNTQGGGGMGGMGGMGAMGGMGGMGGMRESYTYKQRGVYPGSSMAGFGGSAVPAGDRYLGNLAGGDGGGGGGYRPPQQWGPRDPAPVQRPGDGYARSNSYASASLYYPDRGGLTESGWGGGYGGTGGFASSGGGGGGGGAQAGPDGNRRSRSPPVARDFW